MKPGSKATLQIFRRGSNKDIGVSIGEFEAEKPTVRASAEPGSAPQAAKSSIGLTVSNLTDAQKKEWRVRGGVKVDAVEGAAARAGVREGDVILSIDNVEVADSKQFMAAAAKAEKGKTISLLVRRGDWTNYLIIRPTK
jgi:serine protease Do